MKKMDIMLVIVAVFVAGGLYFSGVLTPSEYGAVAVVYIDGEEYKRLPLDEDTTMMIETAFGENEIIIKNGMSSCSYADCRDQVCVNQKEIDKLGEAIVCLPHKVIIKVEGNAIKSEIDVVVY